MQVLYKIYAVLPSGKLPRIPCANKSLMIFGAGIEVLTFCSVTGSVVIVLAFGILAYDIFRKKS